MSNIKYVGMDVHKSITVIVVLDAIGQVESRSQVKTKAENLCDFASNPRTLVARRESKHNHVLSDFLSPDSSANKVMDQREYQR